MNLFGFICRRNKISRMILRLIPILVFLLTLSCNSRNAEQVRAREIYDSAMKIHDAIMPMMDDLYRQKQRLESFVKSLKQDSVRNASEIERIHKKIQALDQSSDQMMQWMHQIKVTPGDGMQQTMPADTGGVAVQAAQKKQIELVREAMIGSIRDAKAINP
jgi:hypothetical protein